MIGKQSHPRLFLTLILLMTLTTSLALTSFLTKPAIGDSGDTGASWLQGWQYRKGLLINSAAGVGTNYPVKVNLFYSNYTTTFLIEDKNVGSGANAWDSKGRHFIVDNGKELAITPPADGANVLKWSIDGGQTYSTRWTPPVGEYLFTRFIFIDSKDTIFVCTITGTGNYDNNGKVYRSTDGGETFNSIPDLVGKRPWSIDEDSSGTLYLGDYGLFEGYYVGKSADGGATWTSITNPGWANIPGYYCHVHRVKVDRITGWLYATLGDGPTSNPAVGIWRSKLKDGSDWVKKCDSVCTWLGVVFKDGWVYISSDTYGATYGGKVFRFQDDGTSNAQTPAEVLFCGYDLVSYYMELDKNGLIWVSFISETTSRTNNAWTSQDGTTWTKILETTGYQNYYCGTIKFRIDCDNLLRLDAAGNSKRVYFSEVFRENSLDGHSRTDFGDVRFTDDDGITLLDYWLESKTDGVNADIWVEVADDLSTANRMIYCYYGKSNAVYPYLASEKAHGTSTFSFFDDFNDGAIDTTIWNTYGSPAETAGELQAIAGTKGVYSKASWQYNVAYRARVKITSGAANTFTGFDNFNGGTGSSKSYINYYVFSSATIRHYTYNGVNIDYTDTGVTPGNYNNVDISYMNGESKVWVDGILKSTRTQYVPTIALPAQIGCTESTSKGAYVDWLLIRKFASPEPYVGNLGNEERLTISSCDSSGTPKNEFDANAEIWVNGSRGYSPSTTYNIFVVADVNWSNGMSIPTRVPGTVETVTSNPDGTILAKVWTSTSPGKYDIVIDFDGDGKYDQGIDPLCNNQIVSTAGFFVIPEYALGTILSLAVCFAGVIVYRRSKQNKKL